MKKISILFLFFAFFPLVALETVEMNSISSGSPDCPKGGVEIVIGDDMDLDGLEEEEITSRALICNGESGCNTISKTEQSYSLDSSKCPSHYGVIVKSGVDCNSDGIIDSGKESETVLCYGNKGSNGSGDSGNVGNSADGVNGNDGKAAEFIVSEEPKGENCAEGGSKIESRFDENGNGTFEASEITVKYVCNGSAGPQGSQGEQGKQGLAGSDGVDGADGVQGERGDKGEEGEIGETGEEGEIGEDGFDFLVVIVNEPVGEECENGGKRLMSGFDTDRNGILDESEVKNNSYICNGKNAVEASEAAVSSGCSLTLI